MTRLVVMAYIGSKIVLNATCMSVLCILVNDIFLIDLLHITGKKRCPNDLDFQNKLFHFQFDQLTNIF